jgi:hypothetical protein
MNLKSNVASPMKKFFRNGLHRQNRRPVDWHRRQAGFGASSMDAAALFGDLCRRCDGMKMERQKKNEQQNSRADKAPESVRMLHAGIKHRLEPKQCSF